MKNNNKKNRILLVSGVDDILLNKKEQLTDTLRNEINHYIDLGIAFTVMTIRTPAALREAMSGIHWRLPAIVMDGAALYDLTRNEFLLSYQMSATQAQVIRTFLAEQGYHYFTNVVENNQMTIYYTELGNSAEKGICQTLGTTAYRCYIKGQCPEEETVVYFMLIDEKRKMDTLYHDLMQIEEITDYKVLHYDSIDYPGYSYIKIYHKLADRMRMVDNLKAMYDMEDCVTLTTREDDIHR